MERYICKSCLESIKAGKNTTVAEKDPQEVHYRTCEYCGAIASVTLVDVSRRAK